MLVAFRALCNNFLYVCWRVWFCSQIFKKLVVEIGQSDYAEPRVNQGFAGFVCQIFTFYLYCNTTSENTV